MIRRLVEWVASKLPPPRVIKDRDGVSPYLSRYYLFGRPHHPDGSYPFDEFGQPRQGVVWPDGVGVYLHHFHRGDDDGDLHNHPWEWGVSLILAGGYFEERRRGLMVDSHEYRPGSINVLRANTFHRVDLREHDAWSLFVVGAKTQSWGFWDRATGIFLPWRDHIALRREEKAFEKMLDELRGEARALWGKRREVGHG